MDKKTATKRLSELRDSLDQILGNNVEAPSREDAEAALQSARQSSKQVKKSLIQRARDLPVLDKISQLGTAGTVAVTSAAVTQTNIAVDQTQVFVASVANDVVERRLYVPPIFERVIDFDRVNSWGQQVIKEKVAEAKAEVAKVEAKSEEANASKQAEEAAEEAESEPTTQDIDEPVTEAESDSEPSTEDDSTEEASDEQQSTQPESQPEDTEEQQPQEQTEETEDSEDDASDGKIKLPGERVVNPNFDDTDDGIVTMSPELGA